VVHYLAVIPCDDVLLAVACASQTFMQRLSEVIQPKPASLSNYRRMCEPCVRPQLQVQADKQLGRVAFFAQVQVRHLPLRTVLGASVPATAAAVKGCLEPKL
jgi:hypothetical protein